MRKKETRKVFPPNFHSHFSLSITDDDPRNVNEAIDSEDNDL